MNHLKSVSRDVVDMIKEVLEQRQIFGKYFIFDGMDYTQMVHNEDQQIDNLLTKFNITNTL